MTTPELAAIRIVVSDAAPGPGDLAQSPSQPPPQVQAPVQQFSWQSRFGTMLIEVRVDAIYVNGQRVEEAPPSP